jgi:hypothetical protein
MRFSLLILLALLLAPLALADWTAYDDFASDTGKWNSLGSPTVTYWGNGLNISGAAATWNGHDYAGVESSTFFTNGSINALRVNLTIHGKSGNDAGSVCFGNPRGVATWQVENEFDYGVCLDWGGSGAFDIRNMETGSSFTSSSYIVYNANSTPYTFVITRQANYSWNVSYYNSTNACINSTISNFNAANSSIAVRFLRYKGGSALRINSTETNATGGISTTVSKIIPAGGLINRSALL